MCSSCPVSYFQAGANEISCVECPSGKYQNDEGKVFCEQNAPGSFLSKQASGQTVEKVCPAGKFSASTSKGECEECKRGKVQPKKAQPVCDQCSIAQYIRIDEHTGEQDGRTCLECPAVGVECDGTEKKYTVSSQYLMYTIDT